MGGFCFAVAAAGCCFKIGTHRGASLLTLTHALSHYSYPLYHDRHEVDVQIEYAHAPKKGNTDDDRDGR